MKTPEYWSSKNPRSNALLPLALIYGAASKLRERFAKPVKLPVPVICIGNAIAGGSGKTPVALAIGQLLKDNHINAFFLSRGYGGSLEAPTLIETRFHSARQVGDEPLLLARVLPTVVAKDRLAGARFAVQHGARAIIMDDGLQNPALAKTLSLLVVDAQVGFGNGRLIPAGPMREPIGRALSRADAVVLIGDGDAALLPATDKPILRARTNPDARARALSGKKVLAFCGLAYPQKFFNTLAACGAALVETVSFPDHHPYKAGELNALIARATAAGALLVTTAKDAVRLPASHLTQIGIVDIALSFDEPELLDELLSDALERP